MSEEKNIVKSEPGAPERLSKRAVVMPSVDIFENKDEVLVVADVPGADPAGLNVHFDKDQLFIEAVVKPVIEEQKPLFREFSAIDYRRVFELSPGIDVTAIKAELKNGVLAVHLPKSAAIKPRKIQIATE